MKKKRIFKFMCLFLCVLFLSGCDGSVTRDIRHAGFNIGGKFICNEFYPKDKEDTSYQKILYMTGSHLINTDGDIYELSLSKTYQDGKNCRAADTMLKVKAIYDNSIFKATDNKYYYLVGQRDVAAYKEVLAEDRSYALIDTLLKDEDVLKVQTADSSSGLYYVLKTDGNVYANVVISPDRNMPPQLISSQIVYSRDDYGAYIEDFNFAGDSLNTFVRTGDKLFRMRVKNSEKCSKYADISCEYEMEEDPIYVQYRDRIITFNGSMLITDYKQIFNVAS